MRAVSLFLCRDNMYRLCFYSQAVFTGMTELDTMRGQVVPEFCRKGRRDALPKGGKRHA